MKRIHNVSAKRVLVLLGIMLSVECLGLTIASTDTRVRGRIKSVCIAVVGYRVQEGKWPESLEVLVPPLNGGGRYLSGKEALFDLWGEPFRYEHTEDGYVIISSGPDKIMGTEDDIVDGSPKAYVESWKIEHGLPVKTNAVQAATQNSQSATEAGKGVSHTSEDGRAKPSSANRETDGTETPPPDRTWLYLVTAALIIGIGGFYAWRKKTPKN